jgi:hypothetical protein
LYRKPFEAEQSKQGDNGHGHGDTGGVFNGSFCDTHRPAITPRIFIYFQIGRLKNRKRYQSIVLIAEIRATQLRLVVTKVMGCGDLFCAGGKANRIAGNIPTTTRESSSLPIHYAPRKVFTAIFQMALAVMLE